MLQYIRRGIKVPLKTKILSDKEKELEENPILTYCNWSFSKEAHINKKTLTLAIKHYNKKYKSYYLRIFNETPPRVVKKFINNTNLNESELRLIYARLRNSSSLRLKKEFWIKFDEI